jgi:hypothetical protein
MTKSWRQENAVPPTLFSLSTESHHRIGYRPRGYLCTSNHGSNKSAPLKKWIFVSRHFFFHIFDVALDECWSE